MTYPGNALYQSWAYDAAHNLIRRSTLSGKTQYFLLRQPQPQIRKLVEQLGR